MFHNYRSLIEIKQVGNKQGKFSFQPVSVHIVKEVVGELPTNKAKATSGEIPFQIVKESGFTFEYLTYCVNEAILSRKFPNSLNLSKIVPVHKKEDATDKCNQRLIRTLRLHSKIFKKLMFDQLYIYLNKQLCDCKVHSTQHALFKLLQAWQKEQQNSTFIGTILMDLSKAYECLSHDLLNVKLGAYGFDRTSL